MDDKPTNSALELGLIPITIAHNQPKVRWTRIVETHTYFCQGHFCPGLQTPVPHPPTCSDRRLTPRPATHVGQLKFVQAKLAWGVRKEGVTVRLQSLPETWTTRARALEQLRGVGYNVDFRGFVYGG